MKPAARAFAIVTSVIIVFVCVILALTQLHPLRGPGGNIDLTEYKELKQGDNLEIISSLSQVTVTADAKATGVSAHLYGTSLGISLGSEPTLEIVQNGSTVTVRAGKSWLGVGFNSMSLDIVIPAEFSGSFTCESSAGAVTINTDLVVKSLRVHSSAGRVKVQNVTSEGSVEVSTSAGNAETGDIVADKATVHSSAGPVKVQSCRAESINIDSSAGNVTADNLSGKVKASSSAGSVRVTLKDVVDSADIWSSAGGVDVSLPAGANANINASTSAGSVSTNGLQLTDVTKDGHDKIIGKLNGGGPEVKVHSSAGSVDVRGN